MLIKSFYYKFIPLTETRSSLMKKGPVPLYFPEYLSFNIGTIVQRLLRFFEAYYQLISLMSSSEWARRERSVAVSLHHDAIWQAFGEAKPPIRYERYDSLCLCHDIAPSHVVLDKYDMDGNIGYHLPALYSDHYVNRWREILIDCCQGPQIRMLSIKDITRLPVHLERQINAISDAITVCSLSDSWHHAIDPPPPFITDDYSWNQFILLLRSEPCTTYHISYQLLDMIECFWSVLIAHYTLIYNCDYILFRDLQYNCSRLFINYDIIRWGIDVIGRARKIRILKSSLDDYANVIKQHLIRPTGFINDTESWYILGRNIEALRTNTIPPKDVDTIISDIRATCETQCPNLSDRVIATNTSDDWLRLWIEINTLLANRLYDPLAVELDNKKNAYIALNKETRIPVIPKCAQMHLSSSAPVMPKDMKEDHRRKRVHNVLQDLYIDLKKRQINWKGVAISKNCWWLEVLNEIITDDGSHKHYSRLTMYIVGDVQYGTCKGMPQQIKDAIKAIRKLFRSHNIPLRIDVFSKSGVQLDVLDNAPNT